MLKKSYFGTITFFALLSLIGFYLIISKNLFLWTSVLAVLVSLIGSVFIIKKARLKKENYETIKPLALILILFIIIFLFVIYPSFIFPFTSSDLMNHSRSVRLITELHGSKFNLFGQEYPLSYYAVASVFNIFFNSPYAVNTILGIIFQFLIIIGIFLISKKWFNERTALISAFIYGFSITSFAYMFSGFLTQIIGVMFFVSAVYSFSLNKKLLELISVIGLLAYPPVFGIWILFLLIQFFLLRDKKIFLPSIISLILFLPEVIGLVFYYSSILTSGYLFRGGIYTPNLLGLLVFVLAVIGFYEIIKKNKFNLKNKNYNEFMSFSISILLFILSVFARFIINLFTKMHTIQIHQFYMAVKYFYVFVIPLSIAAASISKKYLKKLSLKKLKLAPLVILLLLVFHFTYFTDFAPIIKQNKVFPDDYYNVVEQLHKLKKPFTIVIDDCFLNEPDFTFENFPYNKLFGNKNKGENIARKLQISRDLQFSWANSAYNEEKKVFEITYKDNEVVKYGSNEKGDYLLTDCSKKNLPIVFGSDNSVRVYKIN